MRLLEQHELIAASGGKYLGMTSDQFNDPGHQVHIWDSGFQVDVRWINGVDTYQVTKKGDIIYTGKGDSLKTVMKINRADRTGTPPTFS